MSNPTNIPSMSPGQIAFYDNAIPALEDADYLVNVTQNVQAQGTSINESFVASQVFSVQGPRYTLPPEDIYSLFPPDGTQGIFDQYLPHVVFTKPDFPWERNFYSGKAQAPPGAHRPPWLALLLFVEGEQIDGAPALLPPRVDGWQPNRNMTAVIPAIQFQHSKDEDILWPALPQEWYEPDSLLQTTGTTIIDVSVQAFRRLVPAPADLAYLSHVRAIDATVKESTVLHINGDGLYSVLLGNRLPDAPPPGSSNTTGRRNILHLVSLEGLEDAIVNGVSDPAKQRVRMISFVNWSFECLPEAGESFSELMNGLLTGPDGLQKSTAWVAPTPALPANPSAGATYAFRTIQNGYVPLRYQTRLGEETVAWYRGPFSPMPVKNFISSAQQPSSTDWKSINTASAAMIYDKQHGMFDVSYAVAWETGRLLALSDGHFGSQLLDWQRNGHQLLDLALERQAQFAGLKSFDLTQKYKNDFLNSLQRYAVTGDFMNYLVKVLSSQLAPSDAKGKNADSGFPPFAAGPAPVANPSSIADLLTQPDIQQALRDAGGLQLATIADWLAQLYLLAQVPFENLLPHAGLLPSESIKFFYLDSNWQDALVEGALSIGIGSSRDSLYQDLMKDLIWDSTFRAVQQVRSSLLPATNPSGAIPQLGTSCAGMLLHSSVVPGWPGLEIRAYGTCTYSNGAAAPVEASLMQPLRLERLSADVLLCLWPAVPAVVTLDEPREGVAFGFEEGPSGGGNFLYLRSLSNGYGTPLCSDADVASRRCAFEVDASSAITSLRQIILSGPNGLLAVICGKLGVPSLKVHDFATQMIRVPEQAIFAMPQQGGHV